MKNKKIIAIAGACLIASSVAFTGCSKNAEGSEKATTAEETTTEEAEEETEAEETSAEAVQGSAPVSDDDYFVPLAQAPRDGDIENYEGLGYEGYFETEALDELAVQYQEDGYLLYDVGYMGGYCGFYIGDENSYFNTGFYASNISAPCRDEVWDECYILMMTQELFETYIVPTYVSADATFSDADGVLRYTSDWEEITYDPETMLCSIVWKMDVNSNVCQVDPGAEFYG